jgi:predicted ATPase
VLGQRSGQVDVFRAAGIESMVARVVEGYHSTVFAYGQTGSGKTWTMDGYKYEANEKGYVVPVVGGQGSDDTHGLVQRCARCIVDEIEKSKGTRKYSMTVSFLEIYNERIYDLLNSAVFKAKLKGNK